MEHVLEAPDVIAGEWRLLETIGEGAEGPVYRAQHVHGGADVALKTTRWATVDSAERRADELARWHHPNIVRVQAWGSHDVAGTPVPYFVMELLPGGDLAQRLDGDPVETTRAVRWMLELLAAVAYLHDRGVYHRDIKPANILLDAAGSIRLADPGLIFFRSPGGAHEERPGRFQPGTPSYRSPEIERGEEGPGPDSDLFSCAVLLHELLTGALPWNDSSAIELQLDGLDPPLARVIATGLHRDPERRFRTARAFASVLAAAADFDSRDATRGSRSEDHGPDWRTRALRAVQLELEEEQRQRESGRASARAELIEASRFDSDADEWITEFTILDDTRLGEGDSCVVEVAQSGRKYDCRLIDAAGARYSVASLDPIDAEAGANCLLSERRVELLAQFREAITQSETAAWHNGGRAAAALSGRSPRARVTVPVEDPADALNYDQRDAIASALTAPVTYIWGPPGTGKTQVIAECVHRALQRGEQTLVVSATNVAVDTALERVLSMQESPVEPGAFARVGTIRHDGALSSWRSIVDTVGIALDRDPALAPARRQARDRVRKQPEDEEAQQDLKEAELAIRRAARAIEQGAHAVGTTIHQCFLDPERFAGYDVVIIDEASMATAAMVWFAAGLAKSRVVISGDFRQLAPVTAVNLDIAEPEDACMLQDPFEVSGIAQAVRTGRWPGHLHALTRQYRMQPEIADLVTRVAYRDNPLRSETTGLVRRGPRVLDLDRDVVFVDTYGLAPRVGRPPGGVSAYNAVHAAAVLAVVSRLADSGYLEPADCAVEVLAPYAAQARLHRDTLRELDGARRGRARVSTVHRFQGQQRAAVLLDLTLTEPRRSAGWLLGDERDFAGMRLVNVAASRAQDTLVILGDLTWLRRYASPYGTLDRLVRWAGSRGGVLNAAELVAQSRSASVQLREDHRAAWQEICATARRSIVVFASKASSSGLERALGVVEEAASRGARVRLCVSGVARGSKEERRLVDLHAAGSAIVDVRSEDVDNMTIVDGRRALLGGFSPLAGVPFGVRPPGSVLVNNRGLAHRLVKLAAVPGRGDGTGTAAEHDPCACGGPMRLEAIAPPSTDWSCLACGARTAVR